jgi:hypothetical protein
MDDLYYGDVFGLDYWRFLDVREVEPERGEFIRAGCLVMLYAMASEVCGGSGSYLVLDKKRYAEAKAAVRALPSFNPDMDRLVAAVSGAFKLIDEERSDVDPSPEVQAVFAESTWIHERFVRQYFISRADDFKNNPYYRGVVPE